MHQCGLVIDRLSLPALRYRVVGGSNVGQERFKRALVDRRFATQFGSFASPKVYKRMSSGLRHEGQPIRHPQNTSGLPSQPRRTPMPPGVSQLLPLFALLTALSCSCRHQVIWSDRERRFGGRTNRRPHLKYTYWKLLGLPMRPAHQPQAQTTRTAQHSIICARRQPCESCLSHLLVG